MSTTSKLPGGEITSMTKKKGRSVALTRNVRQSKNRAPVQGRLDELMPKDGAMSIPANASYCHSVFSPNDENRTRFFPSNIHPQTYASTGGPVVTNYAMGNHPRTGIVQPSTKKLSVEVGSGGYFSLVLSHLKHGTGADTIYSDNTYAGTTLLVNGGTVGAVTDSSIFRPLSTVSNGNNAASPASVNLYVRNTTVRLAINSSAITDRKGRLIMGEIPPSMAPGAPNYLQLSQLKGSVAFDGAMLTDEQDPVILWTNPHRKAVTSVISTTNWTNDVGAGYTFAFGSGFTPNDVLTFVIEQDLVWFGAAIPEGVVLDVTDEPFECLERCLAHVLGEDTAFLLKHKGRIAKQVYDHEKHLTLRSLPPALIHSAWDSIKQFGKVALKDIAAHLFQL